MKIRYSLIWLALLAVFSDLSCSTKNHGKVEKVDSSTIHPGVSYVEKNKQQFDICSFSGDILCIDTSQFKTYSIPSLPIGFIPYTKDEVVSESFAIQDFITQIDCTGIDKSFHIDSAFVCVLNKMLLDHVHYQINQKVQKKLTTAKRIDSFYYTKYHFIDASNAEQGNIFLLFSKSRNILVALEFYDIKFVKNGFIVDFKVKADNHTKYYFVYLDLLKQFVPVGYKSEK